MNLRKPTIYFLSWLEGSKRMKYFKKILQYEKMDREEIEELQREKLERLLLHAYENVPYYHRVLKEVGVVKDGRVYLENFNRIPILTKEIIRKEKDNLYSKDHRKRKSYENTSGGSTGEPVRFLQDREYDDWNVATKLYAFNNLFGKEIGQVDINLWGSERDIERNRLAIKDQFKNFLYNRTFLNAFRVSEQQLSQFVEVINTRKPVSMWVYVESIDTLARFIEKEGLEITSPKFIISTAGTLYPEIRERVEKVFKCPVYNQYGSREVGAIAIECEEKRGLHEFFWFNYIEVIKNNIYITSLNNYSMPIIRYQIGDVGLESSNTVCACRRASLKFREIKGREISHLKTKKGDIIHGQYIIHLFYFRDWVEQFQVIQEDYERILIKIVGEKSEKEMKEIEEKINMIMKDRMSIDWEFVKEIEATKSGKYMYIVSKL